MSIIRILIVDDESAHRLLTKRALLRVSNDLQIWEASSISEARQMIQNGMRLVLVDFNLGSERGVELVRIFRIDYSIPIIILSTSDMDIDHIESYQSGANCYVVKHEDPKVYQLEIAMAVKFFLRDSD